MEKGRLLFIFALLAFLPIASAISIDLKPLYQPGQTIITKISGNILEPITAEQVQFLRGHVKVPFEYDLKKLGNDYYLWALAPLNVSQNYTLLIKSIATTVNGQKALIDFTQNFSISGNRTDYAIKPGFVFTSKDFELKAISYIDEDTIIPIDFPVSGETFLKPGENTLKFSIKDVVGAQLIPINIGKYTIPAYILGSATLKKPEFISIKPSLIHRTQYIIEEEITYEILLFYTGKQEIKDLEIIYNQDKFSIAPEIIYLQQNEESAFNLTLKNKDSSPVSEIIYIQSKAGNFSLALPVEIEFSLNEFNQSLIDNRTNTSIKNSYYCIELGGKICTANEVCTAEEETALDGRCCIGLCSKKAESTNRKWLGYVLGALIIIIAGYAFLKYKRTKADKNIFSKKVSEAEKKLGLP